MDTTVATSTAKVDSFKTVEGFHGNKRIVASYESFDIPIIDRVLSRSKNFRKLSKARVNHLYLQIVEGNWNNSNGVPIIFDEDGLLLDGQHRLAAVRRYLSEVGGGWVDLFCVRGANKHAALTVDRGKQRTAADYMSNQGSDNPRHASTICNAIVRITSGKRSRGSFCIGDLVNQNKRNDSMLITTPLSAVVAAFNDNYEVVSKWSARASEMGIARMSRPGLVASFLCVMEVFAGRAAEAEEFYSKLMQMGSSGTVIDTLRKQLCDDWHSRQKMTGTTHIGRMAKAWKMWLEGRTVERLFFTQSGPRAEPWPDVF